MRLFLAIRAFFAVLFGGTLPRELLPAPEPTKPRAVEPPKPVEAPKPAEPPKVVEPPKPVEPQRPDPALLDAAAVRVLAVLQAEARLLDFVSEDIDGYGDADVGAAVRDIHKGLRKALADHFPVEPVRAEAEDAVIGVAPGFDPAALRLVGNVIGEPPFTGRLKHKGWRVKHVKLPRIPEGDAARIVQAAEVEL